MQFALLTLQTITPPFILNLSHYFKRLSVSLSLAFKHRTLCLVPFKTTTQFQLMVYIYKQTTFNIFKNIKDGCSTLVLLGVKSVWPLLYAWMSVCVLGWCVLMTQRPIQLSYLEIGVYASNFVRNSVSCYNE